MVKSILAVAKAGEAGEVWQARRARFSAIFLRSRILMFHFSNSFPRSASPYLSNPGRLGDVIAAIQVMAVYKFYKLSFDKWADRIVGDVTQAEKWKRVFLEHPEFFRLDSARERASLVWRRQFPKLYAVDQQRILSYVEYQNLDVVAQQRVSRVPLSPADIKALIDTAVNLHSRALEHRKDKRWWIALASALGGLVGSALGRFFNQS